MNAHGERTVHGFCAEMDALDRWGEQRRPTKPTEADGHE